MFEVEDIELARDELKSKNVKIKTVQKKASYKAVTDVGLITYNIGADWEEWMKKFEMIIFFR